MAAIGGMMMTPPLSFTPLLESSAIVPSGSLGVANLEAEHADNMQNASLGYQLNGDNVGEIHKGNATAARAV